MTPMDKAILITLDIIFAFFGLSNLIAFGADYRHVIAGFAGSLFVTTTMKEKNWGEKIWFALGGFSFVSFVAPAACTYFAIEQKSTYGVGIHFGLGITGMAIATLILAILDQTKSNVPTFVAEIIKLLILKVKTWLRVNENDKNNKDSGSDSVVTTNNPGGS